MHRYFSLSMLSTTLILVCTIEIALSASLPSNFFNKCKADNNDCLKGAVQDAFKKLGNGIKDLKMPGIDPLLLSSVIIEPTPGPLQLHQNYSSIQLLKLSQSNIKKFTVDLDNCKMQLETETAAVQVKAHYILKGHFLLFTIDGEGDLVADQDDLKTASKITCEKFMKDGDEFLRIIEVQSKIKFGNLVLKMGELLKGNAEISKEINKALNNDPTAFHDTIQVAIENIMQDVLTATGNQLFTQVSIKEIFDI